MEEEVAAEAEDDCDGDRREEIDEREVEAVQDDRLLVRLPVLLVHAAELALLRRSRLKDWTTRMPAMSSARVAVTVASLTRTAL